MTHKDLSNLLGVSETTVKSYRRKFPDCIPVANNGKPIRFLPEAGAVCLRIRDLFGLGMSVQEIRNRLAEEFTWIKKQEKPRKQERPAPPEQNFSLPSHLAASINNLSKSMVNLSQQQNLIIKSLAAVEARLGMEGGLGEKLVESPRRSDNESLKFEAALKHMEGLMENLNSMGRQLYNALEETGAMQRNWASGVIAMEHMAQHNQGEKADDTPISAYVPGSNVVNLKAQAGQNQVESLFNKPGAFIDQPKNIAPPRNLLNLAMVVRGVDGAYVSVDGYRGKLSFNDFKAMVSQSFLPPYDYRMQWRETPQGWMLNMEQAHLNPEQAGAAQRNFRMMFIEQVSNRGISAFELVQLQENERLVHPARICAFISEMREG